MITINADSLASSMAFVRKRGIEAKALALKEYRSKIMRMYRELLLVTPQYSSDMVSNWDIETDQTNTRGYVRSSEKQDFVSSKGPHEAPHEAGEIDAGFSSAYARGLRRMQDVSYYGQPVYFVNPTLLEIDSPLIFDHTGVHQKLRDGTVVTAWESITSYLQARFGS